MLIFLGVANETCLRPQATPAIIRHGRLAKESLNLTVGDFIIRQDEAVEVEGQPALVSQEMKGKVLSLHDGFHLDVAEVAPIPPRRVSSAL